MEAIITVFTASLAMELNGITKAAMLCTAGSGLKDGVDFLIFDPKATERSTEDEGRTLRVPAPTLREMCYAQIDDYGGDTGKVLTIYKSSEK